MSNAKKVFILSSFVFMVFALSSCADIFEPDINTSLNNAEGTVMLYINSGDEAENTKQSGGAKTFLPEYTGGKKYDITFTNSDDPNNIKTRGPFSQTESSRNEPLETGTWDILVTQYETIETIETIDNVVEHRVAEGTGRVTVKTGGTYPVTVNVAPILDATAEKGRFKYEVVIASGVTLKSGELTLRQIDGDFIRTKDLTVEPSGTIEEVPAGNYDVIVTLTNNKDMTAGAYSSAIIYSGLQTNGKFVFNADQFVEDVYLAGPLTVGGGLSAGDKVTIIARDTLNDNEIAGSVVYNWPIPEWILRIAPGISSVYFDVEIEKDGALCKTENVLTEPVTGIGSNGMYDIPLSVAVYLITTEDEDSDEEYPDWPADAIAASQKYASPGQNINLTINSKHGLKHDSLVLKWGNEELRPERSGEAYSFIMPAGNVTVIAAEFFTGLLSNLTFTPELELTPSFTSENKTYTATVPNEVTAVTVAAEPQDIDTDVSVTDGVVTDAVEYDLDTGVNEIAITVTPRETAGGKGSETYNIKVTCEKSSNADLFSLTVNDESIFDPNKTVYNLAPVENSVTNITIIATAVSPATVSGDVGIQPLKVGPNTFVITVTAENGNKKTYIINVTRKPALSVDNTLSSIVLYNDLEDDQTQFDTITPVNFTPTITVGNYQSKIRVEAIATDDQKAVVQGNTTRSLEVGQNIFTFVVIPESGTPGIYTLTVNRLPMPLISMTLQLFNEANLSLGVETFTPPAIHYQKSVGNDFESVTITTVVDSLATLTEISYNNTPVTEIQDHSLVVGTNTFTFTVTTESEGKTYEHEYTVVITRAGLPPDPPSTDP